jgi:glycosyltransferase involved in cell wall biosynthesis
MDARIDLRAGQMHRRAEDDALVEVLSADAVRALLSTPRAILALGRYRHVDLLVEDARGLVSLKPQLAARWLARGICRIVDHHGVHRTIGLRTLVADLTRLAEALFAWPVLKARIAADFSALDVPAPAGHSNAGPPLYLRCDIAYGVRTGGALAHIRAVIMGLAERGFAPVLAAVERPETIPASIPFIRLDPGPPRWFRSEQTALAFNRTIDQQLIAGWRHAPPRFVYQRHALGSYAGLLAARRFGAPLVLEYNGPETWVARHWGGGLKHAALLAACEDLVLRRADLVVTVSDVLTQELLERGIEADKIVTIPNGVDLDQFLPAADVSRLRADLGLGHATVVGFIGTFGPWHGVEILVQAFAKAIFSAPELQSSSRLLLVGDGVRAVAVRELIDRLGIGRFVIMTGVVPQAAAPDYVSVFDVAVAPTVPNPDGTPFFGSPTKVFEYMAAGRAIVASSLGQVGSILRDGDTALLVPGGDIDALASALLQLLRNPSLRRRLGAAARYDAERNHGYAARTAQLLEALQRRHLLQPS